MKNIAIIGAGRVGTSLGYALKRKGHPVTSLSCSSLASAEESARILGQVTPSVDNIKTARGGDVVFICVPDDSLTGVVSGLKEADLPWTGKTVFHCSGLHSSEILKPLKKQGASTASFHPIQAFPVKKPHPETFQGITFGLEGDEEALHLGRSFVRDLDGRTLVIQSKQKAVYHAACTISSNFLVVLLDTAVELFKSAGLDENQAAMALLPLVEGTLKNMKNQGMASVLTGPIVRGDEETLRKHIKALEAFPAVKNLYKTMAVRALSLAEKSTGLSQEKVKAVSRVLEEK